MQARIISSIILIAFVIATIFLFPVWLFAVVAALFIALGLYELFALFNNKGIVVNKTLAVSLGMTMPAVSFFAVREDAVFISIFVALFIAQFTRKNNSEAVNSISSSLFGIFYVGWLFSFLVKLRLLDNGAELVAFLLLVAKSSDIGAYIIGSKFGRRKLIPRLSPNKTVEGFIGGIVLSIVAAIGFVMVLPDKGEWSMFLAAILGVVIGMVSQFGDLVESLIKRDCQAKDAGRIIPGLGGVLDVIDSVLLAAPVFYYICYTIEIFGGVYY